MTYVCIDRTDPAGHFMRVEFRDEDETYVVFLADQRAAVISKQEYDQWLRSEDEQLTVEAIGGYSIVWQKEGPEIWVRSVQRLADFRAIQLALGMRAL